MYLIVGLGNPEGDYSNTRHNMGFDVVNGLSKKLNIDINKSKFKGLYGSGLYNGEKVILLKPQTFMNLSGESVRECVDFFKIDLDNVIIIYDDIDLEPGNIRIKKMGGPGTHNGMRSVVDHLGSNFPRVRIGIGKPKERISLVEYVIGHVAKEDRDILDKGIATGVDAIMTILDQDIDRAMNKFN